MVARCPCGTLPWGDPAVSNLRVTKDWGGACRRADWPSMVPLGWVGRWKARGLRTPGHLRWGGPIQMRHRTSRFSHRTAERIRGLAPSRSRIRQRFLKATEVTLCLPQSSFHVKQQRKVGWSTCQSQISPRRLCQMEIICPQLRRRQTELLCRLQRRRRLWRRQLKRMPVAVGR